MAGRRAASSVPPDDDRAPIDRIDPDLPAGPVAFETAPLARRRTVPTLLIVVGIAAVLAAALLKPWGGSVDPSAQAGTLAAASPSSPATAGADDGLDGSPPPDQSAGPRDYAAAAAVGPAPETLAVIVTQLAADGGKWGIGVGGTGPRLSRDDSWTEWQPVDPVAGAAYPRDLLRWPGTDLCLGVPQLYDGPSLLAVTVPPGLEPDWRILTWRSDGTTIAPLSTTLRQVSPPGDREISYLEYPGTAPWPDGRYEFHVVSGDHVLAMTVCLVRNL